MRIAVDQLAAGEQRAAVGERRDHRLGRLEHVDPGEQRRGVRVVAVLGDRVRHLEAVAGAELEVVGAVRGRDVDEPRALLGADEIGREQRHLELVALAAQRMARRCSSELLAAELGHDAMAE